MKIIVAKFISPVFNDGVKSLGAKAHNASFREEISGLLVTRPDPYGTRLIPWQNVRECEVELEVAAKKVA